MLFTRSWWKFAGIRAARTSLGMIAPYVGVLVATGDVMPALTAAVFGAILSLATSLRGLREVTGENIPKWQAILTRAAWSLGQGALTGIGTATLLTDVDWGVVWQTAASATVTAIILGVLSVLPETEDVVTELPQGGVPEEPGSEQVDIVPEGSAVYSSGDASDGGIEGDVLDA